MYESTTTALWRHDLRSDYDCTTTALWRHDSPRDYDCSTTALFNVIVTVVVDDVSEERAQYRPDNGLKLQTASDDVNSNTPTRR